MGRWFLGALYYPNVPGLEKNFLTCMCWSQCTHESVAEYSLKAIVHHMAKLPLKTHCFVRGFWEPSNHCRSQDCSGTILVSDDSTAMVQSPPVWGLASAENQADPTIHSLRVTWGWFIFRKVSKFCTGLKLSPTRPVARGTRLKVRVDHRQAVSNGSFPFQI